MRKTLFAMMLVCLTATLASAATTCTYLSSGTNMVLQSDCWTDAPIIVPNGMTHDGGGHKITAIDPPGGHFRGAILQNGGASASVVNTAIETSGLANVCEQGADMLAAVLFDGASGTISGNVIHAVNKHPGRGVLSSCQEGNAIEAVNSGALAGRAKVTIAGNTIHNYQKTGIVVGGAVDGIVEDNIVEGAGPQGFIGQNGIQIGSGASASVRRNKVIGNSYTGTETASGGIVVASGPVHRSEYSFGVEIEENTLVSNDVGVWLMQMTERRESPVVPTRIRVVNNVITNDAVTNTRYQAAITAHGNGDLIRGNRILGAGYDPATNPGKTLAIDAYQD
jgi:hypothetical protein